MEEDDEVAETGDAPSAKKPRKSAAILEDSDDEDAAQPQGGPPQVLAHGNFPFWGCILSLAILIAWKMSVCTSDGDKETG
jgi:hypothetical protein